MPYSKKILEQIVSDKVEKGQTDDEENEEDK